MTARYIRDAGYISARAWTPTAKLVRGLYRDAVTPHVSRAQHQHLLALVMAGTIPAAVFRIAATDRRWCEHLEPGMLWDVYAFDDEAGLFA